MRIQDKIDEISVYVDELKQFAPRTLEEYKTGHKTKAACERYFEKIVEAAVDLAFLVIKDRILRIPEDDKESFDVLAEESLITQALADRLKDAKGMRNIIAHQYGVVDDEIVFKSITEELMDDIEEFLEALQKGTPS